MRELYTSPVVEMVEFDAKDVIATSETSILYTFEGAAANQDTGWTGLY